jgi:aerobic-type carbon monoxide dehydrogenase small subunit (CoxS/CutS family)
VLDVLHAELGLQREDLVCGAGGEDFIHVVDDERDVCAAVLGHALLDGEEVAV